MTTEEDEANNIKDDSTNNTNNDAADNDDEEHQHQNEQNEQQSVLFESLLIKRIVKFLNYKPSDFAITLLPPPSSQSSSQSQSLPLVSCDETINDDEEDDDNNDSLLLSLTPEYRILLETSIMLIREEEEDEEEEEDVVNENDNDNDNDDTPKATTTTTTTTTATTAKYHLGLEAQNLPVIAKTIRKVYHTTKMKMKKAQAMKLQEDNNNNNNENKDVEVEEEETETKTTTLNLLLFNITSCLLLIQPDHSTVWSDRRRCLLFQIQRMKTETQQQTIPEQEEKKENEILLMIWYNELDYLDLLMTQHSKAPSSWAHRKYVLRQLLSLHTNKHHHQQEVQSLDGNNMTSIQDLVMKEVNGICSRIAEQYPKNYYAWTHRIYVVSKLLLSTMFIKNNTNNNTDIIVRNINNISNFLETELKEKMYNEWLPKHPTDHSAIHYTCQILDHMFDILNQKEEYYVRVYLMEMYDIDDSYEQLHHQQQIKNIHAEVVKKKYELSSLALKQVQILLSKYCQSSNSDPNCNCNESLWILRRMTCQIIWKHSSSSSSYVVIKHHAMMMMMRQLVRNDIKSVIDSLNIIPTRISSSLSDKEEEEEEDSSLSLSLSQLVDAGSANGDANGDDEKIEAISYKNNIHSWTFLAWCIVNITNIDIDVDDNNDNSNSNDNEKTKTKRPPSSSSSFSLSSFSSTTTTTSTLFTHDLRETVMRRLQGAEATATTTTATAANYNGSTADATATAATTTTATSTTVQHNTRIWTSSSSPNILLV